MAAVDDFIVNGNVIDGKAVAAKIREEIAAEVKVLQEKYGQVPGLAVVIVGERKDSQTYVRMKKKACEEVGLASFSSELPADVSQDELLETVRRLNEDPAVHGILVQLPLPRHIDEQLVLAAISVEKDVDGFHPLNIGRLAMKGREPLFVPCTPLGCIELLLRTGTEIRGKRAVVVGRSNIVGMPVAMLLIKQNATVTICHSATQNMEEVVKEADIVVAAAGQAELIRGSWIKPGAVLIDVGTNPLNDPSRKTGYRLVGDIAFAECKETAGLLTPVPGGVGPMTIAMLLRNTLDSAKRILANPPSVATPSAPRPPVEALSLASLAAGAFASAVVIKKLVGLLSGGSKKQ